MKELLITLPHPPKALAPNARPHYMAKSRAVANYKGAARLLATEKINEANWKTVKRASLHVKVYFRTNRTRDKDNFLASMKSALDGFAEAGVIKNDSGFDPQCPEFLKDKDDPRVEVTIREINPGKGK